MKISLNWLRDYIDIKIDPAELSEVLTSLGLEVEGMEEVETIPGGLEGLVVGHVLECGKHPNADRLSLTKVDVGAESTLQIVCGAPNVSKGQKVVVAMVGTTLYPTGGEPFKIKKGKIRGEVSEGMICAEDEIGISTDHEGIIILPNSLNVGTAAADHYKIETDIVYDIDLTPNRSDATSHLGVARDLSAYFKVNSSNSASVKYPDSSGLKYAVSLATFPVEVESFEGCPRFTSVSISNLAIGESPDWMKKRLEAIGVRTINNVVDITNYVLYEYGQPLHAYDLDNVAGNRIVVKTLAEGTVFKTLDEVDRKLRAEDLIVCDGNEKPMCIAGIFGGAESGVTESTTEIVLEAAHWNPTWIRRTSTHHNLRTDAAKSFEKGMDPNRTLDGLKRAAFLMQEYAGGQLSSDFVDIYPKKIEPRQIQVEVDNVRKLIGNNLSVQTIEKILKALNIEIVSQQNTQFEVRIPTDKRDVTREADVIEEILRIYGFNKVEIDNKLSTTIATTEYPEKYQFRNQLADFLVGKGFQEIMGLSLLPSSYYEANEIVTQEQFVRINNTSNVHLDIMRPEMLLSGMESVRYNLNRQQKDLRFFEFGKSYQKAGDEHKENEHLSIYISGAEEQESWLSSDYPSSFYSVKKIVHELLAKLDFGKYQVNEIQSSDFDFGLCYKFGEKEIIRYGQISAKVLKNMEIKAEVFSADFDLSALFERKKKQKTSVTEFGKFPTIRRDISLTMDQSITYEALRRVILKTEKKLIKDMNLFDVYKNEEQLGKGQKSYAISMIYKDRERTLNDKQVDKSIRNIMDALRRELNCEVR